MRAYTWFHFFDETGMVTLLKGMRGPRGATLFGESQSSGAWQKIRVVVQIGNSWKTHPNVAKVEPH